MTFAGRVLNTAWVSDTHLTATGTAAMPVGSAAQALAISAPRTAASLTASVVFSWFAIRAKLIAEV